MTADKIASCSKGNRLNLIKIAVGIDLTKRIVNYSIKYVHKCYKSIMTRMTALPKIFNAHSYHYKDQ